jgi:hypothetical protein
VLFLGFLPPARREEIRASWYVGATGKHSYETNRPRVRDHGTQVAFVSPDEKAELLGMLVARNPRVSGPPDLLNRCAKPPCDRTSASAVERLAERALQPLAGVRGRWVRELPEVSFLLVRAGDVGGNDAVYALIHDRAHTNVASMFEEDERLDPEKDTLTVARGYLGSYPNFLFEVNVAEMDEFADALSAVRSPEDLEALVGRFGVRRTSPRFWQTFDWIQDDFRRRHPTEAGLFDLNRYQNL